MTTPHLLFPLSCPALRSSILDALVPCLISPSWRQAVFKTVPKVFSGLARLSLPGPVVWVWEGWHVGETGPVFNKETAVTPSILAGSYEWADGPTGQRPRAQGSMYVGANKQGTVVPVGQERLSGPWGKERVGTRKGSPPSCVASGLMCSAQGETPRLGTVSRGQGLGRSALWRKAGLCCVSETPSPQAGALG